MSILCGWIRFGSMFVRRLPALHMQGLGGMHVFDWMKKKQESKQWKQIQNIYLTTVALTVRLYMV